MVSGLANAAPATTQFTISGDVASPTSYSLEALQVLPPVTEMATYRTAGGPQTGTFTGPPLWTLLNSAGLQSPPVKNGLLRQFIVATGSDGYSAVFALGELAPQFGGGSPQNLVAYQADPPLGANGFARIVAPKDDFGGRYVANLSSLQIGTAPAVASSGGGDDDAISVSRGPLKIPADYELSDPAGAARNDRDRDL